MTGIVRAALAGILMLGLCGPARAADPSDPEWPCVQRKVEHLSAGAMWPQPLPEEAAPLPPDQEEVAARLALRRVSEEEARTLLEEMAAANPGLGLDGYGRIFLSAFERIDRQRADIVAGIGRYARNQARLAEEIDGLRSEMAQLEAAAEPDFDRMDAVEAEIDWRERIFTDRNRALTYVCESPVLLEQRAFAIARMMQEIAG